MSPTPKPARPGGPELGERLRGARLARGLSLRDLARRVDCSASLISQIERQKVLPSVKTLYALVSALGLSFDGVLEHEPTDGPGPGTASAGEPAPRHDATAPRHDATTSSGEASAGLPSVVHLPSSSRPVLQRAESRRVVPLGSGVVVEELAKAALETTQFLVATFEVGAESSPPGTAQHHAGQEWIYVVRGAFDVTVGFDRHELRAGDSIAFPSVVPHRVANTGDEPAVAIFVLGGSRLIPD